MGSRATLLLRISTVLWVIWGAVHLFAGYVVISSDASGGFAAIADAVDPASLTMDYPAAVGGILNQHGWNLAWGGFATIIGAVFIWRQNLTAIWVTGMVGGQSADLAAELESISASAVILSFWVWLTERGEAA